MLTIPLHAGEEAAESEQQIEEDIEITRIEPLPLGADMTMPVERRKVAWLGLASEEAPGVLASQLKLDPGAGLVVTFVVEDSPADKAGLERNDLLVGFEDQALVHPAQLRKLVQSRKEGDKVRLTYFREGNKQTAEVVLGETEIGPFGDAEAWREQMRGIQQQIHEMPIQEELQKHMEQLRNHLGHLEINQQHVQQSMRHAMEQVREAMKSTGNQLQGIRPGVGPKSSGGIGQVDPMVPRLTVRSSGAASQSLVQADDTGTYVLVRNPRLRLTAHNSDGDLLFDGEIETEEQRAEVPPELWEKVKPLVQRLSNPPRGPELKRLPGPAPQTPVNPPTPQRRGTI